MSYPKYPPYHVSPFGRGKSPREFNSSYLGPFFTPSHLRAQDALWDKMALSLLEYDSDYVVLQSREAMDAEEWAAYSVWQMLTGQIEFLTADEMENHCSKISRPLLFNELIKVYAIDICDFTPRGECLSYFRQLMWPRIAQAHNNRNKWRKEASQKRKLILARLALDNLPLF